MTFICYFIKFQQSDYFQELIKNDKSTTEKYVKIIKNQMNKYGSILCQKILQIYINTSLEQIIETVSKLFEEFIYYNKTLVINGMSIYLKECPNDILTNKEKETFIKLIDNYSIRSKDFNKFLDNFINRCISKQIRARGSN